MNNSFSITTQKKFGAYAALSLFCITLYYWYLWGDFQGFTIAFDHCTEVFCDFSSYFYPMGEKILILKRPIKNYFYSPFFAILLYPLTYFTLPVANYIWGITQLFFTIIMWFIPQKIVHFSDKGKIFYLIVFFLAYPILHNFKWGQVSVIITLAIFMSIYFYQKEYFVLAAVCLAAGVAIKYYPIIFIIYPLMQLNKRFLISFFVATFTLFFLFPALVLGPIEWFNFQIASSQAIMVANQWVPYNLNSQYMPYVFLRWMGMDPFPLPLQYGLQALSWAIFVGNLGFIWKIQKDKISQGLIWSTILIFLSFPFFIQTSWPHYFVALPFCQIFIMEQLIRQQSSYRELRLFFIPLFFSVFLSTVFAFNLLSMLGEYRYGSMGALFFSNTLLLLIIYKLTTFKPAHSLEATHPQDYT